MKRKLLFINNRFIKAGATRIVFMFPTFVIKVPRFTNGLRIFICGWNCNYKEYETYNAIQYTEYKDYLCPIKFNLLGLILVMKRAAPVEEFIELPGLDGSEIEKQ
jgi:hypothetical protein